MGWFRKINKNGEDYKPIGNVITATSLSVTGPDLADGDVVRVMFTTDIAGSDTSTPLALTWNSGAAPIPVKAMKNGSLVGMYAIEYAANLYRYISAYATLELAYDATNAQFVVVGNPVVLSGSNYTIYADGFNEKVYIKNQNTLSQIVAVSYGEIASGWTAPEDGFMVIGGNSDSGSSVAGVYIMDIGGGTYVVNCGNTSYTDTSFPFNKGDIIRNNGHLASTNFNCWVRYYNRRDYTDR